MSDGLVIENLVVYRGELPIIRDVSLAVPPGKVTVLLGANGAGKSTLLDSIAGIIPIKSGTVSLAGTEITSMRRNLRAKRGLSYVEQGRSIFGELTVEENLAVATARGDSYQSAFELFPELIPRRNVQSQMLSGGEQQMLVLARALASKPTALMIDEMSQGLAPVIVHRLMPFVSKAAESGIAVLLVEQFASLALKIGDHASVLSIGKVVLEGTCSSLLTRMDDVRDAYLAGASASEEAEEELASSTPQA